MIFLPRHKNLLFLALILCVGIACLLLYEEVKAAATDNMTGFAWSGDDCGDADASSRCGIGWISFNLTPSYNFGWRYDPDGDGAQPERDYTVPIDHGIAVAATADDAYHDPDGWPNYSHSDLDRYVFAGNPGGSGAATWGGWRWARFEIPQGTFIADAYVRLWNVAWGYQAIATNLAFERTANPNSFSSVSSPYHRWANKTNFQVSGWVWGNNPEEPVGNYPSRVRTPSLKAGIQELVDLLNPGESLKNIAMLEDGTGVAAGQYHSWMGQDNDPDKAARLYVEYGGTPADFGVNVEVSGPGLGAMRGYAWSSAIGWIKLDPTTTPPVAAGSYNGPAHVDVDPDPDTWLCGGLFNICGWARACAAVEDDVTCEGAVDLNAGGWDGWISLRGDISGGGTYGLSWDSDMKEIQGWAWGGGDVVGWINFNQAACSSFLVRNGVTVRNNLSNGGTGCPIPSGSQFVKSVVFMDLEVPPAAENPRETYANYCTAINNIVPVRLEWDFADANAGDVQEAFQVIIRADGGFDPAENITFDSCPGIGLSGNPTDIVNANPGNDYGTCENGNSIESFNPYPDAPVFYNFPFDDDLLDPYDVAQYAWRVRVKDSSDDELWSAWSPFFTVEQYAHPTVIPPDETPRQFGTINHQAPDISFSLIPSTPTLGELVTFTDASTCYYSSGGVNSQYDCKNNNPVSGAANRYQWDFDGDGDWDCDSDVNPSCRIGPTTFTYTVLQVETTPKLRITNPIMSSSPQISHTCETTRSLDIGLPFPEWEEVSPF